MPALNIDFSEDEIAKIRERANAKGISMRKHVHDTVLNCGTRAGQDDVIMQAVAQLEVTYAEALSQLAGL